MDDDLDTSTALTVLGQLADRIIEAAQTGQRVQAAQETLRDLGKVFGLRLDAAEVEPWVTSGWNEHLKRFDGR